MTKETKTIEQLKILDFIEQNFIGSVEEIYWTGDDNCRVYTTTHCMDIACKNNNIICSDLVLKENEMPFL